MKFFNKSLFLSVSGVVFLAGCAWWPFNKTDKASSSASNDQALLIIDGKPVLTVQDYEDKLEMARQSNPQVEMFLSMMPNAEKDLVFRGIATAELMKAWALKNGLDQTSEFKKQRQQLHEAVDSQLYMKAFDDAHPVQISDSELKAFYEEKKEVIPALMLAPAGINVTFVTFDNKAKAEAFLAKVKDVRKESAFKALADETKYHVNNAVINQNSQMSDEVKGAVLAITKFPSVHMMKADQGNYLVVLATGKTQAQYRDLSNPEIKAGLTQMLTAERKNAQIEALISKLKDELHVIENTGYFDEKEAAKRGATQQDQSEQEVQDNNQKRSMKV
jgi:hypothetical protein